jgi:predicted nucleotidyltransferase
MENELIIAWRAGKLVDEVDDEKFALQAIRAAEEKVKYTSMPKSGTDSIIHSIKEALKNDGRVSMAWLFGSVARGDQELSSDIDIMVEMNLDKKYSMFDLLDIAHTLELKTKRKVDLVEKGCLKHFALKTATNDIVKIYG